MGPTLTMCMPYYDNAVMLARQYVNWRTWPAKYRKALRVVIVDDGSPTSPAANVPRPYGLPELAIYRVADDRPWWQHGARNIAAHEAANGWLLLTDMDHMLPPEAGAALIRALPGLDSGTAYMLDRVEADTGAPTLGKDGKPKPHPNTFVMTRKTFWRVGGYDERLCGVYGTDKAFRARVAAKARLDHLSIPITRFWRDLVPDASTTTLPRKEGRDVELRSRLLAEARAAPDAIKVLSQTWSRVV